MPPDPRKNDWIDVVDRAIDRADRFADRFRKTPRKRLAKVPEPLVPSDPFSIPAAAAPASVEPAPLGDAGLPVQIYGRRTCDKTGRAVQLLREASVVARMIDLSDPDHRDLEKRLIQETKSYDTPWVYVRGVYRGGFDEIARLTKSGELQKLLAS